ncbi:unnamed protein product [Penicillium pancosmium]
MHVETTATSNYFGSSLKDGEVIYQKRCIPGAEEASPIPTPTPFSSQSLSSALSESSTFEPSTQKASSTPAQASTSSSTPANTPISKGYPTPVLQATDDSISDKATEFVQKAKAAGKKKLIIDLSFNGGGNIGLGLDLFKLFFPSRKLITSVRFRAHEGANLVGQALSRVPLSNKEAIEETNNMALSLMVTPDQNSKFNTWSEVYGPLKELGTNVSSLKAFKISLPSQPSKSLFADMVL